MEQPYDSEMAPKPQATKKRNFIGNLQAMLNCFQPVLVNESGEKWEGLPGQIPTDFKWNGTFMPADGKTEKDLPTLPQLINIASAAIQDVVAFTKLHEKLKQVLMATQKAFADIEVIVLEQKNDEELRPLETISEVQRLKNFETKAMDVLRKAATSTPEQSVLTVQAFLWPNGTKPTPLLDAITKKDTE